MNEISSDQATLIHDIASYKEVMGVKRFKRTKEEMSFGLTPKEALERRLNEANDLPLGATGSRDTPRASTSRKGNITIKIRSEAGVDPEYFQRLSKNNIELILDEKFFLWLDNKLEHPYNGNVTLLFQHILDLGIGEVITQINSEKDIKNETKSIS